MSCLFWQVTAYVTPDFLDRDTTRTKQNEYDVPWFNVAIMNLTLDKGHWGLPILCDHISPRFPQPKHGAL
jgi:hypothetical protein